MIDTNSNQVVVLGASIAGLLTARVLSERFERVVVIERDVLRTPAPDSSPPSRKAATY